jgi:hypothetical protein
MTPLLLVTVFFLFMELFMGVILIIYTVMNHYDEHEFDALPVLIRSFLWSSIALLAISGVFWIGAGIALTSGAQYTPTADVIEGFIAVCETFSVFALWEAAKWKRRG